ncbi:MAG: adenylyltransferase/cytidyltransferase family protein [Nanoarchaeota archaeon]
MSTVLVTGTFDILHPGHQDLFRQAKKHGETLIVLVARDATVEKVKGRPPRNNEHQRLLTVYNEPLVDEAVLGSKDEVYAFLEKKPDVICIGYDQEAFVEGLKNAIENKGLSIKIVRLQPYEPEKWKSSKM